VVGVAIIFGLVAIPIKIAVLDIYTKIFGLVAIPIKIAVLDIYTNMNY
jgi:glutaredoxin 2